jgi:Flp pilus assembly pilin Flp
MFNRSLRRFRSDTGGATAIEYGLIAALIALMLVMAFSLMRHSTRAEHKTVEALPAASTR